MKFISTSIVFQEVPDEITLALEISNCPHNCKDCHSPELREDIGTELTVEILDNLIKKYSDCTCICFMGGDRYHNEIVKFSKYIKDKYPNIKIGFYSGDYYLDNSLVKVLDYYKIGPYVASQGPLNNPKTNQIFYKIENGYLKDITKRFQH